jgi:hypothetical protein
MFVSKECVHIATNFDIWMFKGIHDVFELVINYVNMYLVGYLKQQKQKVKHWEEVLKLFRIL